jgi:prepilin-type processing-associated H-X9-DG protein
VSFCVPVLPAIPAVILGFLGLRDISRSRGRLTGQGLAIGGIVTGFLGVLLAVPLVLLLPAIQKVRQAADRAKSVNNLKRIGIAMQNYHDSNSTFPPSVVYSKDGKPLYSWRVLLLPSLEQEGLYRQFHLDEPWDSPHNIRLLNQMPKVYESPARADKPGYTLFKVFDGKRSVFDSDKNTGLVPFFPLAGVGGQPVFSGRRPRIADITDGTSNTILFVEAGDPVPWTKPEDLPFAPDQPLPKLDSPYAGGFNAAFADGSVRFIRKVIKESTLRALITKDGSEVISPDDY